VEPAATILDIEFIKMIPALKSFFSPQQYRNISEQVSSFERAAMATVLAPILFSTQRGLLGTAPLLAQPTDEIWILPEVPTPMVLRNTGVKNRFRLIGPTYVYGIMDGQATKIFDLAVEEIQFE